MLLYYVETKTKDDSMGAIILGEDPSAITEEVVKWLEEEKPSPQNVVPVLPVINRESGKSIGEIVVVSPPQCQYKSYY